MKKRKRYVTEETIFKIDEDVLKINALELFGEMFVQYFNEKYGYTVLEISY
jgi:hypothetical protein